MNSSYKILISAIVSALLFAACNKGTGGAKVTSPKSRAGAGANKPGANKPTADDSQKKREEYLATLPSEKAKKIARTMTDMLELKPLLRDSSSIFIQTHSVIVKDNKAIIGAETVKLEGSIFSLLEQVIGQNYSNDGVPVANDKLNDLAKQCTDKKIKFLGRIAGEEGRYNFSFKNCDKDASLENVLVTIKAATSDTEPKRFWTMDFTFHAIAEQSIGDSSSSPIDLSGLLFGRWMPHFYTETSGDANKEASRVACKISKLTNGRLASLVCENLGQDSSKDSYVHFKKINFFNALDSAKAEGSAFGLKVSAEIFRAKDDANKESIKVELEKAINSEGLVLTMTKTAAPELEMQKKLKKKLEDEAAAAAKAASAKSAKPEASKGEAAGLQQVSPSRNQAVPSSATPQPGGQEQEGSGEETEPQEGQTADIPQEAMT